jgi:hypothetical protein
VSKRDIDDELKKVKSSRLPTGGAAGDLRTIYDIIYSSISGTESSYSDKRALLALKLLLCGKKKLSIRAFLHAVNVSLPDDSSTKKANLVKNPNYPGEVRKLTESCQGLIVQDEISNVLPFQHPSIAQYLRERAGYEIEANAAMAEACMANLLKEEQIWPYVKAVHYDSHVGSRRSGPQDDDRGRTWTRTPTPGPPAQRSASQASS